jgi:uncharacterized PurR-regulated membrane protein YhhQ (DUF165 family)
MKFLLAAAYVASVVAANYLTEHYGLVSVGFGLLVTAGTFAAGVSLVARNLTQDLTGRVAVVGLMIVGVVLSWFLATPALAVASGVAFALSESTDMLVYTGLRKRGWTSALVTAGLAGALVDTLLFLHIAGFPVTTAAVEGQLLVKGGISILVAAALLPVRHRQVQ